MEKRYFLVLGENVKMTTNLRILMDKEDILKILVEHMRLDTIDTKLSTKDMYEDLIETGLVYTYHDFYGEKIRVKSVLDIKNKYAILTEICNARLT